MGKAIIVIPTYNEAENIERLLRDIVHLGVPELDVLVVDDNSPDNTAAIVRVVQKEFPQVKLLVRTVDRGRGRSGRAGFEYAFVRGYDCIIEMDADFSHDPKYIPTLIDATNKHTIAIGSRQVDGGADIGRTVFRRLVTKFANLYIRLVLGLPVRDCNSGYRSFPRTFFERIPPDTIQAPGPDIVQELLYRAHLAGFSFREIPIRFVDRDKGVSKLRLRQLIKSYQSVLRLRWRHFANTLA